MWLRPRPCTPTQATRTVLLGLASAEDRSATPAEKAEPRKYRRFMPSSITSWLCRAILCLSSTDGSIRQIQIHPSLRVGSTSRCPVLLASEMSGSHRLLHYNHLGGG